jgi:hypothetical protein
MAFDREKFKAMVHLVCSRVSNRSDLGAVKLNKVCWLADFVHYYNTGEPITDARYVKRQFGPVPAPMQHTLRELERDGSLVVKESAYHGYAKTEFAPLRQPDTSRFTMEEIELIERMIRFVCEKHTANSISQLSHDHVWHAASDGEEIPYFTVFAVPGELTDSDREWARMQLEN